MAASTVAKPDLKRELKYLYAPESTEPHIVTVPAISFLMVDGQGDPNGGAFKEAVGALYSVAYTLKFTLKKEAGSDYTVMPLEGLWGVEGRDASLDPRDFWQWTAMIAQPVPVTPETLRQAISKARAKTTNAALDRLRLEEFHEGESAQVLHLGPYAAETENIRRLHDFIAAQGLRVRGRHHEIYLSDPGRTAPERLKTVIRYAVAR